MVTRGSMDLTLKPGARMPKGRPYFQKAGGKTEQKKGKNKKVKGKKDKEVNPKTEAGKRMGPRRLSV